MADEPRFIPLTDGDRDAVLDWVSSETWPFHVIERPTREEVAAAWQGGGYMGADVRSFWVELDGERVGLLRIQDLDEDSSNPCLDLRLRAAARGRGLGTACLRWLTAFVFENFPRYARLEGQTRQDNTAMRRAFRRCGYLKEAHYRAAWPAGADRLLDSIGYGMLREDWYSGCQTPLNWDDEPR